VDPTLTDIDDFDTVMVQMRTATGRQCHINCCREAVYGYDQRFEILGSAGMLQNENLRQTTVRRWTRDETEAGDPLLNFFLERYADAYQNELNAFIDAVQSGSPMPVTPFDGRQALRLADCALESALTGRAVTVSEQERGRAGSGLNHPSYEVVRQRVEPARTRRVSPTMQLTPAIFIAYIIGTQRML
jgi:myo-inositol 2-dehydrogenase/D-chiro-inositol 1-dehydrogenase